MPGIATLDLAPRWIVLIVLVAACGRSPHEGTPGAGLESTAVGRPDTAASAPWTVDPGGYGPLRAGMTRVDLEAAVGELAPLPSDTGSCYYLTSPQRPEVAFMIIEGRLARIDVRGAAVRTAEGAAIGDTEERIRSLYAGRLDVQPHKYVEGHYLIVSPASADTTHRIVFETEAGRVTRFRSGRLPEVRWIEGCS